MRNMNGSGQWAAAAVATGLWLTVSVGECDSSRLTLDDPPGNEPSAASGETSSSSQPVSPPETSDSPEPSDSPALEAYAQVIPGTAVEMEMVPIPADPEQELGPLWISRTEVTWDAYDAFVYGLDETEGDEADAIARPSQPYISMDRGFGHAGYPAISMSLHSAQQFCAWLSARTGRTYRLPSVEEWRSICERNRTDDAPLDEVAWHAGNAEFQTHPVGEKAAGALGLHDMLGNAGEWAVLDNDGDHGADAEAGAAAEADGSAQGEDEVRGLVLGGTYREPADEVSCAAALTPSADWNASDPQLPKSIWWLADAPFVGFRVVCEPESDEASDLETGGASDDENDEAFDEEDGDDDAR